MNVLLLNNANPNIKNNKGEAPLHIGLFIKFIKLKTKFIKF